MSVSGLLQTLHFTRSTFHGATFEQKKKAGLGVVIRNQEGLVMASLSQLIQLPPSTVIEVEALAARRALELALELGFDRIVLEALRIMQPNGGPRRGPEGEGPPPPPQEERQP